MKLNISEELVERVRNAAANGSKVAQILVEEFKKGKNDVSLILPENSKANFFMSKRSVKTHANGYKRLVLNISCCNKDVENDNFPDKGNPNAPFFKENRTDLNPSTFAKCFKEIQNKTSLRELTEDDYTFFDSAIRLNSKVTLKLCERMSDIEGAYDQSNYSEYADSLESNLHNSCMRYNDGEYNQSRNAADFYANFCGAKILVAYDANGSVLGRAIVWNKLRNLKITQELTLIDRMYFCFGFVRTLMIEWAKSNVDLMKNKNDFNSQREVRILKNIQISDDLTLEANTIQNLDLYLEVPAVKWHKKGAPYCDSLYRLYINNTDNVLYLTNTEYYTRLPRGTQSDLVAELRGTSGYASRQYKVCPICGKTHYDDEHICNSCLDGAMENTIFGRVYTVNLKNYRGMKVPSVCFDGNKPKPTFLLWHQIQRLYRG